MNPDDWDGSLDGFYEDGLGFVHWSEHDWDKYLKLVDEVIDRYHEHYKQVKADYRRLERVAKRMGWTRAVSGDPYYAVQDGPEADSDDVELYTLHKNHAYIVTCAIYKYIINSWNAISMGRGGARGKHALLFQQSLYHGRHDSVMAIQAMDVGDNLMAACLFRRALQELNLAIGHFASCYTNRKKSCKVAMRSLMPAFFDMREVYLLMIAECREQEK